MDRPKPTNIQEWVETVPIEVASEIRILSEDEFHELAETIIGFAFDIHNDFGRLLDEEVYKRTLLRRCEVAGVVPAQREVEIVVQYQDFRKSYFMDLLFASGLMVEGKAAEQLNNAHYAQTLNYLLLTGMHHALLVNLRPVKVEKQFVSTTLTLTERRRFSVNDTEWTPLNEASLRLRKLFLELLKDWGVFLQTSLYREAIIHFFGGSEVALRRIPVFDGPFEVGNHEVCLLDDDTALALTSLSNVQPFQNHLERFLKHTRLKCIQWINLEKHDVEFRTIVSR